MNSYRILFLAVPLALGMALLISCAGTSYVADEPESNPNVVVPPWAPPYDNPQFVRYYYLPDIEVYYDVWNQEFVYLDDGNWIFVRSLPPMYAGFDLYNCFVVVLDDHVFEPWMHHQYYVSHYPRYYYHSLYHVTDARDVRGFNENHEKEIRTTPEDRRRYDEVLKNRADREKMPPMTPEKRQPESTRPPQRMKYYGEDIGKHVRVQPQMRKPREIGRTRK